MQRVFQEGLKKEWGREKKGRRETEGVFVTHSSPSVRGTSKYRQKSSSALIIFPKLQVQEKLHRQTNSRDSVVAQAPPTPAGSAPFIMNTFSLQVPLCLTLSVGKDIIRRHPHWEACLALATDCEGTLHSELLWQPDLPHINLYSNRPLTGVSLSSHSELFGKLITRN